MKHMLIDKAGYIVGWRCWYDDGTSQPKEYNSTEHSFEELPEDGFQAMRLWYKDGTGRFISGNDFYFFSEHAAGLIVGQTNDSLQSIYERYNNAIVKRGKHVPDLLIKQINDLMMNCKSPLQ